MLYTDGSILSISDLREHDNFVLDVASTEGIELNSKLAVAQRELGYELSSFLLTKGPGTDLSHVFVTVELRDLLATHTLSMVYRDAYNLHLNDRYLGRWREFTKASERGLLRFLQNGVGLTAVPVAQGKKPDVGATTGGLPQGFYSVQIAWQHVTGNIGEKSSPASIDLATSGGISVNAGIAPANVTGWHVFIAVQEQTPMRQNESPLAPGTQWTQAAGLRDDLAGPYASGPDYFVRNSGLITRG